MEDLNLNELSDSMGIDPNTINQFKKIMQDPAMRQKASNMIKNQMGQGDQVTKTKKIKPNSKCPCDSGKKYKKCCYKLSFIDQTTKPKNTRKPTYTE